MPEGQYTGERKTYDYTSDSGTTYQLVLDETLGGLAGTGLGVATTASTGIPKPIRFKPRVVYWEGTLNNKTVRKAIVCDDDGSLYTSNVSVELTIDGVTGKTTGRRGEKLTFAKLESAT